MHLDVTLKPGTWIDPPRFFKQIGDAGYGARKDDTRLTLTGKLTKDGDRLLLTLDDVKPGPQSFVVVRGTSKDAKEAQALDTAWSEAQKLAGQMVELEGRWKPGEKKGAPQSLAAIRVTPVKAGG